MPVMCRTRVCRRSAGQSQSSGPIVAAAEFAAVVDDLARARHRARFEEEEAEARVRRVRPDDLAGVHAVDARLIADDMAERGIGQFREPRRPPADPAHRHGDIQFRPADGDVERERLLDAQPVRRREAQHRLADADQVVPPPLRARQERHAPHHRRVLARLSHLAQIIPLVLHAHPSSASPSFPVKRDTIEPRRREGREGERRREDQTLCLSSAFFVPFAPSWFSVPVNLWLCGGSRGRRGG